MPERHGGGADHRIDKAEQKRGSRGRGKPGRADIGGADATDCAACGGEASFGGIEAVLDIGLTGVEHEDHQGFGHKLQGPVEDFGRGIGLGMEGAAFLELEGDLLRRAVARVAADDIDVLGPQKGRGEIGSTGVRQRAEVGEGIGRGQRAGGVGGFESGEKGHAGGDGPHDRFRCGHGEFGAGGDGEGDVGGGLDPGARLVGDGQNGATTGLDPPGRADEIVARPGLRDDEGGRTLHRDARAEGEDRRGQRGDGQTQFTHHLVGQDVRSSVGGAASDGVDRAFPGQIERPDRGRMILHGGACKDCRSLGHLGGHQDAPGLVAHGHPRSPKASSRAQVPVRSIMRPVMRASSSASAAMPASIASRMPTGRLAVSCRRKAAMSRHIRLSAP